MTVLIREIEISDHVRAKINSKHGLTEDDVLDACENMIGRPIWSDHPEHGLRLLVTGRNEFGRIVRVILYPVDPDRGTWRLGTALCRDRD